VVVRTARCVLLRHAIWYALCRTIRRVARSFPRVLNRRACVISALNYIRIVRVVFSASVVSMSNTNGFVWIQSVVCLCERVCVKCAVSLSISCVDVGMFCFIYFVSSSPVFTCVGVWWIYILYMYLCRSSVRYRLFISSIIVPCNLPIISPNHIIRIASLELISWCHAHSL